MAAMRMAEQCNPNQRRETLDSKEMKIGEIRLAPDGNWYKSVISPDLSCFGCAFWDKGCCGPVCDALGPCSENRTDKNKVHFKDVDARHGTLTAKVSGIKEPDPEAAQILEGYLYAKHGKYSRRNALNRGETNEQDKL